MSGLEPYLIAAAIGTQGVSTYLGIKQKETAMEQAKAQQEKQLLMQEQMLAQQEEQYRKYESQIAEQEAQQARIESQQQAGAARDTARARQKTRVEGAYGRSDTILTGRDLFQKEEPQTTGKTLLGI